MVFAQAISVHGQIVCLTNTLPLHLQTCRATRQSVAKRLPGFTWGWAPPAKQHTKNSYSGAGVSGPPVVTSPIMKIGLVKGRTTRPVENEGVSEAVAVAEVEAGEYRDKKHGRAAADSATHTAPAHSAWDSPAATTTEKDATRSRLGELHRLLNNRKGSLSATF